MRVDFIGTASKIAELPVLRHLSPSVNRLVTAPEREGYLACQRLAEKAIKEIAALVREGWTERQAARLLNTYLRDCGVHTFFHEAFAWFGERTRFTGIRRYRDFLPSERVLREGEVFILDVAPIYKGYMCDIGFTASLGPNPLGDRAKAFLEKLRREIPGWFDGRRRGEEIWNLIDERIGEAGYDNIHEKYPFSVLGHRVHRIDVDILKLKILNFGWQSYWSLLSRGLFGQLLNGNHQGDLVGLWAIEPNIGTKDFGAKFE